MYVYQITVSLAHEMPKRRKRKLKIGNWLIKKIKQNVNFLTNLAFTGKYFSLYLV